MPKKQVIREKRFVLDDKEDLKGKWVGTKGELLTLSYDYSPEISEDLEYKEFIEVAVENFNRLGLARLVYQPVEMGIYIKGDNLEYLKFKYKNHIIFSYYTPLSDEDKTGCSTEFNSFYTFIKYTYDLDESSESDNNRALPPFAEIQCRQHRNFSRIFLGLIQHEFNHLFGIHHPHGMLNTNGIYPFVDPHLLALGDGASVARFIGIGNKRGKPVDPNILALKKKMGLSTFLNIYNNRDVPVDNYTLISPFSIQHYPLNAFEEYRIINKTRINELLDNYNVSEQIKQHYFYLLDKYAGKYFIYTYQDMLALATAVYQIAPDSLVGTHFNFLNYYFVEGMYLPKQDKLKFIEVVNTLMQVENFTYPFLWQEEVRLTLEKDKFFSKNLVDALKIVTLNNHHLSCSLQKDIAPNLAERLSVDSDCFIRGVLESAGEYEVPIIFRQHKKELAYKLRLLVEEKDVHIKNRVLLGKNHTVSLMEKGSEDFYVDLAEACQVVAYPIEKRLSCGWVNSTLESYIPVQHCMFLVEDTTERNLSFIFSNAEANKTCVISFLLDTTPSLESNADFANISSRKLAREAPFVAEPQSNPLSNLGKQLNYCVTIPFSQGIVEGVVDGTSLHAYVKSGLKVLPRIALWYLDYFNRLNFSLIIGASLLEGAIKNSLKNKVTVSTEKFISIVIFLGISELEYGFSNLWTLADQPQFLPELTDKFNQLFLQWIFSPMIKTLGYTLTVNLMNSCLPSASKTQVNKAKSAAPLLFNENQGVSEISLPMKSSVVAAMQDACQTVFSRRTFKLFSFFKINSTSAHAISNSDRVSISLK